MALVVSGYARLARKLALACGLPLGKDGQIRIPSTSQQCKRGILMTNHNEEPSQDFVVTKGYRLFTELCDVCRRACVVGLGYGSPGTGKTKSASYYAQWNLIKPFLPEPLITFTGRNTVDGLYPYRPLTFASALPDAS